MKTNAPVKQTLLLTLCWLIPASLLWTGLALPLTAQDQEFRVIDDVDMPSELAGIFGGKAYLEFRGTWTFLPEKPALRKESPDYLVMDPGDSLASQEELLQRFAGKVRQLSSGGEPVRLEGITYEFNLMDPHLENSPRAGFNEADSMDKATRELQEALIGLVEKQIRNRGLYRLEEQLLSVRFQEVWTIDPASLAITRQVESLIPVIWQRRRTVEGEAIDEATSGWPVYYKNSLEPVFLRNP
jgi:hypothetical protein